MAGKRLLLLRHAKSSWDDPSLRDLDRPLTGRGRRDAERMGRHLREGGMLPDLVVCSPASRAVETLEGIRLPGDVPVRLEAGVYAAGTGDLLTLVQALPVPVESVMIIGHNPALEELARSLVGESMDSLEKFPTAALADLRFRGPGWVGVRPGTGRLAAFITPRSLG